MVADEYQNQGISISTVYFSLTWISASGQAAQRHTVMAQNSSGRQAVSAAVNPNTPKYPLIKLHVSAQNL